ncbi:MAG: hypothetical protein V2A77_07355, partial [Pseudomonadota bacterium]
MSISSKTSLAAGFALLLTLAATGPAWAIIASKRCAACHTMHNYQHGVPVVAEGPQLHLLNKT